MLVRTDNAGYKSLAYANITAVLVEAVKQLEREKDAQIAAQNERLADLTKENKDIRARLERMEAMMARLVDTKTGGVQ